MQLVVLGAGLMGVTSAYRLAEEGHDVTVIDRREGPGLETSFANGGQLGFREVSPWAAPDVPWTALKMLGDPTAPFRWISRVSPPIRNRAPGLSCLRISRPTPSRNQPGLGLPAAAVEARSLDPTPAAAEHLRPGVGQPRQQGNWRCRRAQ